MNREPDRADPGAQAAVLISVLVRSTGRPELQQALASVAAQDYPRLEIVIADAPGNGRIDVAGAGSVPVRVVGEGAPLRRSAAANLLLAEAAGPWVLFLDDDDWMAPGHVARLAQALASHPGSVAAYAGVSCVEAAPQGHGEFVEVRAYDSPFDAERLLLENYIPIHAALVDLAALRTRGTVDFDEGLDVFEDWDFWLQCAQLGDFVHVPGISAYYRIHDTGLGVRMDEAQAIDALDRVLARWGSRWTAKQKRSLITMGRNLYRMQPHLADLDRQVQSLLAQARHREEEALRVAQQHAAEIGALVATHEADVASIRAAYESSRSWRITRPLRAMTEVARRMRPAKAEGKEGSLRGRISAAMLRLALRAYKSRWLGPVIGLVPFGLKRRCHQLLMNASLESAPAPPAVAAEGRGTRVSIVIPVYNHAAYLRKCLQSALDQDWPDLEVIVIDDASPDPAVAEILESFRGDPRLRLSRNARNLGISETQNAALEASTGGVIAFLDCDDYLARNAISSCMRAWKDDTVYLHTGRVNVDAQDREVGRIHFLSLPRKDYFAENLEAMYATHLKVIRRDAFAKVGLFDPRFDSAQDYDMLMRIAFHYPTSAFVHVPDFVYFHRFHGEQATGRQAKQQAQFTETICREARLRQGIREGRYARKLSFIMLSFGKHSQTLKAIQGLKATVKVPHEIVLYDNGSQPETVDFIRAQIDGKFDDVKVVYGDRNLGPAQGRRRALDHATGEWFIVFDNDEWPEPGWLEELLVRAESQPDVGAVCCKVAFPDRTLQFSAGCVQAREDGTIDLGLLDRGARVDDLRSCRFREVEWCPIGATLFTVDIRTFLHEGYPNVFEDAAVSFALKKNGRRLLNSPGSLVWHDHVSYMPRVEMQEQYMQARYDPKRMLTSVASFYAENGLLIYDEYIWRENGLKGLPRDQVLERLAA
jgi:glycosyltransferase involved in cell wall biosynthesis